MLSLNRKNTNNIKSRPLKVMQFGAGNFVRAFVDWAIHVLNNETNFNGSIAVIKPTKNGGYTELKGQEGLFTVVLDGIKDGDLVSEKTVVTEVSKVIHSYAEWHKYLNLATEPELRFIVSNTTEAGIKFNSEDKLIDSPAKEFPAKLTRWLHDRYTYFKGDPSKGCILLPCELIEDNGGALQNTILQYASHWQLEEGFEKWIKHNNYFCNTLVDRIVSGYPKDRAEVLQNELGFSDQLLVAGEYYHSWVIQGHEIVQKELPFAKTNLNVEFVEDLAPYREMKVRILNGAHTSMVPVGYLAGIRFVKEAMDDEVISDFVETLLLDEVAKTLDFPDQVKTKFVNDVLDRFRNPLLKHQLISISLNSTSKFVARLLPTLKDYLKLEGKLPKRIVFGFSALLRFYKREFNGETIAVKDDQKVLDFIFEQWKNYQIDGDMKKLTKQILENSEIWGEDLSQINGLTNMVTNNLEQIEERGIKKLIQTI